MAERIKRGEIWLYTFSPPNKRRPVLILTRQEVIGLLNTVMVAPVTSTIRGVPSEVALNEQDGLKSDCAVNLHNAITVSQQRLGRRVTQLGPRRMREIHLSSWSSAFTLHRVGTG